ncbi:MAG: hypothetical protein MR868_09235 [Lachnospiraceae bacterium]|nr:hypothetical protein [Lachnospiraceae bacterium]
MKKAWLTAAVAGMMTAAMVMPVFAAEWKQDTTGWWYQQDDGSYPSGGWEWIDGRCYYFDETGYCLLDTTTPDGYTVDASGAWTVDGTVQVQETQETAAQSQNASGTITVGGLTVIPPAGFTKVEELSSADCVYFANASMDGIVGVATEKIPDMGGYESLLDSMGEQIIDYAMAELGTVDEKSTHEFASGTWYCYRFANASEMGFDGQLYVYARIRNAEVEMVLFMGNLVGVNMDGIMNQNLR